jgi:hypothetical protein
MAVHGCGQGEGQGREVLSIGTDASAAASVAKRHPCEVGTSAAHSATAKAAPPPGNLSLNKAAHLGGFLKDGDGFRRVLNNFEPLFLGCKQISE